MIGKVNMQLITNKNGNYLGEALKSKVKANSKLKLLTSYFTIYALEDLAQQLNKLDEIQILLENDLLFEEGKLNILGNDEAELLYRNQMQQHIIAEKCAR